MNHSNTIKFKYDYPEGANDKLKTYIDFLITNAVNKTFWELYHEGHITNFYLIDEDMEVSK